METGDLINPFTIKLDGWETVSIYKNCEILKHKDGTRILVNSNWEIVCIIKPNETLEDEKEKTN